MFYLTDFYLCFYSGNYKVQKWDMHKHDFLDSAPGLGMFVTVLTPTSEVNILNECFCVIRVLTSDTGRQNYQKIRMFWG